MYRNLVGRGTELAYAERLLDEPVSGSAVLAVVGEPGIGKTRFVAEVVHRARARDWCVADPGGTRPGCPSPAGGDGHSCGRLVVLVDDAHQDERRTAGLLSGRAGPAADSVLMLLAYRPRQLSGRLARALASAAGRSPVYRVELHGLSPDEARLLLAPRLPAGTVDAIHEAAEGNPLYLSILAEERLRSLRRSGPVDAPQAQQGLAVLRADLETLPVPLRQVGHAAAVLGPSFDIADLPAVAGLPDEVVAEGVETMLHHDLLRPDDTPARLRFRHPMVWRAVGEGSGAWWRRQAHERAAALRHGRGEPVEMWAHHVEQYARAQDLVAARQLTRAALAVRRHSPTTAARWFAGALRLLPATSRHRARRSWLSLMQAESLVAAGCLEDGRQALTRAVDLLPRTGWRLRRRTAVLAARVEQLLGHYGEATALLDKELATEPADMASGSDVRLELAAVHVMRGDFHGAAALVDGLPDPVTPRPGRAHDPAAEAIAALARCAVSDLAAARTHADRVGRILDAASDTGLAGQLPAVAWLGWADLLLCRFEPALARQSRAIGVARTSGQTRMLVHLLVGHGMVLRWTGRLDEARTSFQDAYSAALRSGSDLLIGMALSMLCVAHTWLGDHATAIGYGERAAAVMPPGGWFATLAPAVLAQARVEAGDATAAVEAVLNAAGGPGLPGLAATSRPTWYEMLTRSALADGDRDGAARWADLAVAAAGRSPLPRTVGSARLAVAHVALADGEWCLARERAVAAAEAFDRIGDLLDASRARILGALAAFGAADAPAGTRLLERARRDATACGAAAISRTCAGHLARIATPPPARPTPLRTLSAREREVSDLVALGHTNKEIAAALFLSVKTVERHLARIFAKVEVNSRASLAAMIARDTG